MRTLIRRRRTGRGCLMTTTRRKEYQFELWKIRELRRIRRDQEERRRQQVERAELERRRGMSNEQILL